MRILFVCLGNICRSPTAESVLRTKLAAAGLTQKVVVDSAGTASWHIGKAPDARTCQAASVRGYDMSSLRARQVERVDFQRFDLVLAMDQANFNDLQVLRAGSDGAVLDLFLRRYRSEVDEVPDPYYGGDSGFERVLDLIESACDALVEDLRGQL